MLKKEMPDKRIGDPRLDSTSLTTGREDDEKGCGVLGAEPLGEGVAENAAGMEWWPRHSPG